MRDLITMDEDFYDNLSKNFYSAFRKAFKNLGFQLTFSGDEMVSTRRLISAFAGGSAAGSLIKRQN